MYVARQAGFIWGTFLIRHFKIWRLKFPLVEDHFLIMKLDCKFLIVFIVVDEILFTTNNRKIFEQLQEKLREILEVKLFEAITAIIGWSFHRTKDEMNINQK